MFSGDKTVLMMGFRHNMSWDMVRFLKICLDTNTAGDTPRSR